MSELKTERKPRQKLRDVATEAEWGFTQDAALMKLLQGQSRELAGAYGLDADDVLQESLLWLAVRPALQRKSHGMILGRTRSVAQTMMRGERRHDHDELDWDAGE